MNRTRAAVGKTGGTTRRSVLRGLYGVGIGLPLLDADRVRAADPTAPAFGVFVVNGNGVVQNLGGEPERFWPRQTGKLSRQTMEAERSTRATGELAAHAERLILVRGLKYGFMPNGCSHTTGDNTVLTAQSGSPDMTGPDSRAMGESIDNRMARELGPEGRKDPLTLHAGQNAPGGTGYGVPGFVSYRGPKLPRSPEPNPWNAYMRMVGLAAVPEAVAKQVAERRKSVNDLVRRQMMQLLARKDLSAADRTRLDQHFSSIRDMELKMGASIAPAQADAMKSLSADGAYHRNENRDQVIRLHMDLLVFALASGYAQAATLKIGDNNDGMEFVLDGKPTPNFHMISHRVLSHGGDANAPPIADAVELHARIVHIYARHFARLLDKLAETETTDGPLLDQGFAVWANQIANGAHDYRNLPYVIAGRARGRLRTGQFIDLGDAGATNNKLLNTLLTAAGVRARDGGAVVDFGAANLAKGVLPELLT